MEAVAVIGPMLAQAGAWTAANAPLITAGIGAASSIYSGVRANQAANFEAKQMRTKGEQELAVAQREAMKSRRQRDQANSRALAVAAASGAGASDPTVTNIMANIDRQGTYNSLTDMYRGFQNRADLYRGAAVRKTEGRDALIGSVLDAGASIYGGIARNKRYAEEYP